MTDEGVLEDNFRIGGYQKKATGKGVELGIAVERRISGKGDEYDFLYYTKVAQRLLGEWR